MAISARKFQFIMELLRKWSLSVNGQYALCDAPRCALCATATELYDLLDCQRCGARFGVRCCWGPYGDIECDGCFFERSGIAVLHGIDEQQFWDN